MVVVVDGAVDLFVLGLAGEEGEHGAFDCAGVGADEGFDLGAGPLLVGHCCLLVDGPYGDNIICLRVGGQANLHLFLRLPTLR